MLEWRRVKVEVQVLKTLGREPRKDQLVDAFFTLRIWLSECSCHAPRGAPGPEVPKETGGADRNRTDDIQLAKLALYQLSYTPV